MEDNLDIDFTVLFDNDNLSISSNLDMEKNRTMILYTGISKEYATELFKAISLKTYWPSRYSGIDLKTQLVMYEYEDIARAICPEHSVIVAFNINTDIAQIYDECNPFSKVKKNDRNVFIQREIKKYNNKPYIEYTIRDSRIINSIQIK